MDTIRLGELDLDTDPLRLISIDFNAPPTEIHEVTSAHADINLQTDVRTSAYRDVVITLGVAGTSKDELLGYLAELVAEIGKDANALEVQPGGATEAVTFVVAKNPEPEFALDQAFEASAVAQVTFVLKVEPYAYGVAESISAVTNLVEQRFPAGNQWPSEWYRSDTTHVTAVGGKFRLNVSNAGDVSYRYKNGSNMTVTPSASYCVGAWSQVLSATSGDFAKLDVEWYTSGNVKLQTDNLRASPAGTHDEAPVWSFKTMVAPATAAYARVVGRAGTTTDVVKFEAWGFVFHADAGTSTPAIFSLGTIKGDRPVPLDIGVERNSDVDGHVTGIHAMYSAVTPTSDIANYLFEAESLTWSATVTITNDADAHPASGNNHAQATGVTPSAPCTAALALPDALLDGRYRLLVRAKVSDANQKGVVEVLSGFPTPSSLVKKTISCTNWQIHDYGEIDLVKIRGGGAQPRMLTLAMYPNDSGDYIDLDYVVLLPTDSLACFHPSTDTDHFQDRFDVVDGLVYLDDCLSFAGVSGAGPTVKPGAAYLMTVVEPSVSIGAPPGAPSVTISAAYKPRYVLWRAS